MTAFPAALDVFQNPTEFDNLNSAVVPHADQHANINDAMEAVQAALAPLVGTVGVGTARIFGGALYLKDTSGGGTPWHAITLVDIGGGVWGFDVNQTGVA